MNSTLPLPTAPDDTHVVLSRMGHTYPFPGGVVAPSTIRRWAVRGVRGIRLRTYQRGGQRTTTAKDVREFLAALGSAVAEAQPVPVGAGAA